MPAKFLCVVAIFVLSTAAMADIDPAAFGTGYHGNGYQSVSKSPDKPVKRDHHRGQAKQRDASDTHNQQDDAKPANPVQN